jgi:hypothetical protein
MELRYKHLEAALASALNVAPARMGAFRARLRYLRNSGLFPNPGSGQQITYTEKQALEMLIALLLERSGHTPKMAATFARTIIKVLPYDRFTGEGIARAKATGVHAGDLRIAVSHSDKPRFKLLEGDMPLSDIKMTDEKGQTKEPPSYSVINASACIKTLEVELSRVLKTG